MRYQEVYDLAQQGYSYQQIADKMGITLKTVYKYVYICKQKTGQKVVRHSRKTRRKKVGSRSGKQVWKPEGSSKKNRHILQRAERYPFWKTYAKGFYNGITGRCNRFDMEGNSK